MALRERPSKFAVAFSLAGEQRELVLPVAQEVEAILGTSTVFYDAWYEHWIAGSDADLLLQQLYGEQTELVIVCISGAYGNKPWTRTEHRAVRARLSESLTPSGRSAILPLRVGEGEVDGVLFTDIVPDIRGRTAAETAELIIGRLNLVRGAAVGAGGALAAWPRTPPDLQWPMADHSEARSAFARLLCDSSPTRVMLVRGASETGKSHMTRQMARNCMALPGVSCGRFDFKGTVNMSVEIEGLCHSLDIDTPVEGALNERLGKIFVELRRRTRPTVLVFDSYEAAGEARDWIENVLLPRSNNSQWLRVAVVGQSVPVRVGTTWESVAANTITLQTPQPEHWLEYGRANLDDTLDLPFVIRAYQYADGKASVLAGLLGPRS